MQVQVQVEVAGGGVRWKCKVGVEGATGVAPGVFGDEMCPLMSTCARDAPGL